MSEEQPSVVRHEVDWASSFSQGKGILHPTQPGPRITPLDLRNATRAIVYGFFMLFGGMVSLQNSTQHAPWWVQAGVGAFTVMWGWDALRYSRKIGAS